MQRFKYKSIWFLFILSIFTVCLLIVILRMLKIAIFIGEQECYWVSYVLSCLLWIILICNKTEKSYVLLRIFTVALFILAFVFGLFRVGSINREQYTEVIVSESGNNAVIVKEYDRPIHRGFSIYKKIFLNVYYQIYNFDTQTGGHPFYGGNGSYEWFEEYSILIRFKMSETSNDTEVIITF